MKIIIETQKNLQSKDKEIKIQKLIEKFKKDLDFLGLKVISYSLPKFDESRL